MSWVTSTKPAPASDTCPGANLASMSSPYTGTTSSRSDHLKVCGNGKDEIFFIDVAPGWNLTIGQTENNFDSKHTLRWGGSCPGANVVSCVDDPDTTQLSWTNPRGSTERAYFVVDGYGTNSHGTFKLAWVMHRG